MSAAPLAFSTPVKLRFAWVILLCAVLLGLLGMHGLTQSDGADRAVGHHVGQTMNVAPMTEAPAGPNDYSSEDASSLLTLCLMVLIPVVAVGLLLLVGSRVGGWHLRRQPVLAMLASELAVPPQPLWRQLGVLRI